MNILTTRFPEFFSRKDYERFVAINKVSQSRAIAMVAASSKNARYKLNVIDFFAFRARFCLCFDEQFLAVLL